MRAIVMAWLLAMAVFGGATAPAQAQTKRVIVTFKSGTAFETRNKSLEDMGARPVSEILSTDTRRSFVAVVAEVSSMQIAAAPSDASIERIEEDYSIRWIETLEPFNLPSSGTRELDIAKFKPIAKAMSAASRPEVTWGVSRVNAPMAWLLGKDGREVRVAVIDTGINSRHHDLANKVSQGYNAITDCSEPKCWQDDNGHGTHVAGTIGALRNDKGVAGVAPASELIAVKVLHQDGSGSLSDVIKGIIWCANNKIDVANMSLGSPMPSETMQRALKFAKARGVVVVAAAGNSYGGPVGYPGAYPETIAVAASDWNNRFAEFSSRGEQVDFIAPGVAVVSTSFDGDLANMSGTSMAAPHVAGLAALAVQQGYRGLDGPDGVLESLRNAAVPLPNLTPSEQGSGMIDALRLVRERPLTLANLQ